MGLFSTIDVAVDFQLIRPFAHAASFLQYQSKDFPDYEDDQDPCPMPIDGEIQEDGRFVRADGKWNSTLCGFARLTIESSCFPFCEVPDWCCDLRIRIERGRVVEIQEDDGGDVGLAASAEWTLVSEHSSVG